jgi:hypothetical protein
MQASPMTPAEQAVIDNSGRLYKAGVEKIDYHIPEAHTYADLTARLRAEIGGLQ